MRTILLVTNEEEKSTKKKVEAQFPNCAVHQLYIRPIKEDRSVGFYYTVHNVDFNLTGNLKNDKLKNLESMDFDLLLDLSDNSTLLQYFINRSKAAMKVGKLNTNCIEQYDLLVDFGQSVDNTISEIFEKITLLTKNEQV
ncbi:MAG: hypothetical protein ABJG68_13560 [Crocinitomicaceae bacterium]